VGYAALQKRFAHFFEYVAEHRLDQVRWILAKHGQLLGATKLRHVGVALQHDPAVAPKLRGSSTHELVENRSRRQIRGDLLDELHEARPATRFVRDRLGTPRPVSGAQIGAPPADEAGRLIPAERGQTLRFRALRPDSPHLLAVDASDQRDATVGLPPAGDR